MASRRVALVAIVLALSLPVIGRAQGGADPQIEKGRVVVAQVCTTCHTTLGRMLADYIGVSWSGARPLVVYALASPPKQDEFRQAIYAASG